MRGGMARSSQALFCADTLRNRSLEGGGFPFYPGGAFRTDATAWAVLALALATTGTRDHDIVDSGRDRLAASQLEDGRVSVSSSDPGSFWPTSLAILAWHGSSKYAKHESRATDFLLRTTGKHWEKQENSPLAHDTSIQGWPWMQDTHSWVEPTSLSILALRITGMGEHERIREGVRMLMDRQLPSGGWNHGNTLTFGTEQFPQADCTGIALNALAGEVPKTDVEKSVKYLRTQVTRLRTPLSLGWGILGLAAWGRRPGQATAWLGECLARQDLFGSYDTTLLSLLLIALEGRSGLGSMFG